MGNDVSRRTFIGGAVAGVVAASKAKGADSVQTRPFGRTGIRVPIIGMGCGISWYGDSPSEEHALEALNLAIDLGITYLDTGQTYGRGRSETWMGKVLKTRRKEVLVSTKISTRDPDEARRETDRCLERLETDHLDVIHIHSLGTEEDLATIEKKGGLLEALYKLRDEKITRCAGITCHLHPPVLKMALERHDFDCTQMALNAAQQGHYEGYTSRPGNSFEGIAMPVAVQKGMAVIAMKVTGKNELVGVQPTMAEGQDLIRYALSLPVSHAVIGLTKLEHIRQNAELARTFQPMSQNEMKTFSARMTAVHKASLDRFFLHHQDV